MCSLSVKKCSRIKLNILYFSSSQPKEDITNSECKGLIPGKSADCYNGAVLDRYSWSQTIKDIEVKIPVPSSVTKGRDVGVEIKSSHLKVWLKGEHASPESGTVLLCQGKVIVTHISNVRHKSI